ncbi:AEC family transporter [Streptomyces sp. NPDC050504]|uniref:AEC family transporter n=1 Tax=Streptomyces sp. NPDC050504 TaxID=3365618 RepID=UPI0037A72446
MHGVLSGFLPIWVITAAGWGAGRTRVLGDNAQHVLSRFAFTFAMPSLLFLTMSRSHPGAVFAPGVLVFAVGLVLVFAVALALGRWAFRRSQADGAIGAMTAAYVNSANLGIPIALHVLGDTSFVIAAALFQLLFVTPTILLLIELDPRRAEEGGKRTGAAALARRIAALPVRNPVIAASGCGLAVAASGLRLPQELSSPLQMLGGAGVPVALFTLGMSLTGRTRPDAAGRVERGVLVALKTVAQPLLAYALGRWVFGLDGPALLAVAVCSGLPTAQNVFVYASEYRLDTDLARDTVLLSTLVSMVSLTVIVYLLTP